MRRSKSSSTIHGGSRSSATLVAVPVESAAVVVALKVTTSVPGAVAVAVAVALAFVLHQIAPRSDALMRLSIRPDHPRSDFLSQTVVVTSVVLNYGR